MVHYEFDEKIDSAIDKSAKAARRFYKELRQASLQRGEEPEPPSFDTFATMAKGLMDASRLVQLDRLRNPRLRPIFEQAWAQKLQQYSTQKLLKDLYETLLK